MGRVGGGRIEGYHVAAIAGNVYHTSFVRAWAYCNC